MDNAKGGPSQPLVERPRRKVSRRVRDEVTGLGWLRCRQTKMGDEDDEGQVLTSVDFGWAETDSLGCRKHPSTDDHHLLEADAMASMPRKLGLGW